MLDLPLHLGRTIDIITICYRSIFFFSQIGITNRTFFWKNKFRKILFPFGNIDTQYLRDDLTGFYDRNFIPDPQIQSPDLVLVVKSCPGNCRTGNVNRLQNGDRSNSARSSNLVNHIEKLRLFFLCFELVGNCPFRTFRSETEFFLQFKIIDFNHDAVNIDFQFGTPFLP